ncbi:MAG: hypothetical protein V4537_04990 [Pseudomonadota bacterium]
MHFLFDAVVEIVGAIVSEAFVRRPYGCLLFVGIAVFVVAAIYWLG